MKGGSALSGDIKGVGPSKEDHKKLKLSSVTNEVKMSAGKKKKHKATTITNEVKQSTKKQKQCKTIITAPGQVPDLSEQADDMALFPVDDMAFFPVDESKLSVCSSSTSSSFEIGDLDDTSDEESEKSSCGDDENVVHADFEFFDPQLDDFHGVKNLLKTYCDGKEWDLNGFVDIILAQMTVGTVIKTDGDSLFGFITALNLARYKDQRCMVELQEFLYDKCLEKAEGFELKAFWEKQPKDVGLLVSERVVNLPFELVPPLYDGLFDEVSWAIEDEPTQVLRDSFQFKHYLILTRVYQILPKARKVENTKKHKGNTLLNGGDASSFGIKEQLIYIKPEDEFFHQLSSWSFTFPYHAEYLATHELKDLKPVRLLMAVKVENIRTFRLQLKTLLDGS